MRARWPVRSMPAVLGAVVLLLGCSDEPRVLDPAGDDLVAQLGLEPMPPMVVPADNPTDPARAELGRLLFFDPILSGGRDVACGTCHMPEFGMSDGRDLPVGPSGVGLGPDRVLTDPNIVPESRNSPTVINVGFNRFLRQNTADGFMFWDGRRRRLESLVTLPIREFSELRGDHYPVEDALDRVIGRIRAIQEYERLFREAFPERAERVRQGVAESAVDSTAMAHALAQFIRSLQSTRSPYDRLVAGEREALTAQQRRGLELFHGRAGCAACHSGPMFSDFDFHAVGARQLGPGFQETPHEDFGRWNATELESDRWKFRTPSLRNVALTAPYMHSGGYATLREVIDFFDRGGGDHPGIPRGRLSPLLRPLDLSEADKDALEAFLHALSDPPSVRAPERLPSGLEPPRLP